jgi:hypothetical protein
MSSCKYSGAGSRRHSPRRFAFLFKVLERFREAEEHFSRSLKQRLHLRVRHFRYVFPGVSDEFGKHMLNLSHVMDRTALAGLRSGIHNWHLDECG